LNKKNEILNYLAENKPAFRKKFKIIRIGLFGSFATNSNNIRSDLDLIIEFEPDTKMLFEKKMKLKKLLKKRFSVEVDICREKYLKKYFKEQILNSAIYV
jgi:predicted nucleotidyltransferase